MPPAAVKTLLQRKVTLIVHKSDNNAQFSASAWILYSNSNSTIQLEQFPARFLRFRLTDSNETRIVDFWAEPKQCGNARTRGQRDHILIQTILRVGITGTLAMWDTAFPTTKMKVYLPECNKCFGNIFSKYFLFYSCFLQLIVSSAYERGCCIIAGMNVIGCLTSTVWNKVFFGTSFLCQRSVTVSYSSPEGAAVFELT